MKRYLYLITFALTLYGESPISMSESDGKIAVQNRILAKINEETISVLDVKKKMDFVFYKNYPHLANSVQARHQFYDTNWKHVLNELIDHQLILADSQDKQIPLPEGDIRQEMESRFGPNIRMTLDKIGLSYDEAWKSVKDDLIVQRMTWWFIHSKAMNGVTPQDIRTAYRAKIKEIPSGQAWKYQVIALRGENAEKIGEELSLSLSKDNSLELVSKVAPNAQVSQEIMANSDELSESHLAALSSLEVGSFSKPIMQMSKADNTPVYRIFYLKEKSEKKAPHFEELAAELKGELIQKRVAEESVCYLDKLRKHYSFYEAEKENFHPFELK